MEFNPIFFNYTSSSLYLAVEKGKLEIVKLLLEKETINPNTKYYFHYILLYFF